MPDVRALTIVDRNVRACVQRCLEKGRGLLRLAPTWVPRAFLQPGRRLKLDPRDLYALGLERGGIDERWFASTTEADNPGRRPDEGLSWCVCDGQRFLLRDAVAECGPALIGAPIWNEHRRWPVYAKFFDNMGPIPHHMHQSTANARLVGREGKPEGYYFPPQHNNVGNNFPYTFFGLTPGTTRADLRTCLARWDQGDNGVLCLSQAHRLEVGTGWLVPPGILHAPGSLCTYEPQWGSDVFAMFQNLVEGRAVPRALLVKDIPPSHRDDLDFIIDQLDWEANVDPDFKSHHHLPPIPVDATGDEGYLDRWIVYGSIDGAQCFTAKELTIEPGITCTISDRGAYGLIVVQGEGRMNGLRLDCPKLIRFTDLTEDEVFCTEPAARAGVRFENTSQTEPLVCLRYFGPGVNPDAPQIGDHARSGSQERS